MRLPLDRGRTLLALGAAQRRSKRRREARETLGQALGVFEEMGASLWAERARAELKRISGRAATPGALTPAEERVASLVAEGKTNKEVAAALFLSDRTVEGHLAHIFGKLGIRHRAELGRAALSNTGDRAFKHGGLSRFRRASRSLASGQVVTRATRSRGETEMTRTISLIIGIAVVALAAVPTAFGEGRLAGSPEQDGVAYFYANERATLADQPLVVVSRPDSHEVDPSSGYMDAAERAARISQQPSETVLLSGDDHVIVRSTESPTVPASGRDVEWPQVGIGFGIGIALAIVLGLSLKATRPRNLAH